MHAPTTFQINGEFAPVVAVALHDGHTLRPELADLIQVSAEERLREEDPYTGMWTNIAATRIVVAHSRFEVDLNRPRDKAVYRSPEDAWGMQLWDSTLPYSAIEQSLQKYDSFYHEIESLFQSLTRQFPRVVVFDLHSYNHRRHDPDCVASPDENPDINIGTGTMPDRAAWDNVIDSFKTAVSCESGHWDVRENIKFQGGGFAQWLHQRFPGSVCVLSIEVKKFFMDEWAGTPNWEEVWSVCRALTNASGRISESLAV